MDGPVSTPAPAGRSSLRPSELRAWKGCREFQRRAGGRSSSQPSHGLVPAPCVPCHQGFLSFLPSSTLAIFLFRDTPFSGKPSLALRPPHYPGGATWVPLPPEGRGPPPFCWQQLPPFYAFNTRTSLGVLHIVDHQQLWGWTLSHPCWGPILPLQPACCVPQDKSLPFSVLPSVTCEMEFGAPAPEGCLGT